MKDLKFNREKKKALATRLPSYSPLHILIRFAIVSVIAVGVLHLISAVLHSMNIPVDEEIPVIFYFVMILSFNGLAELQIILDNILERFFPIPEKIKLRIFIQITGGILFLYVTHTVLASFLMSYVDIPNSKPGIVLGLLIGLVFVQMIANSLAIARLTQKWLDSQEEIAAMKQEKLSMDYNSLQDQLNPHFLFNNLSVLKSLIIYDQDTAVDFIENFTDVYRYVLQSKDKRLVKFSEELEFIESFIGLHKERLGEGIDVSSSISKEALDKEIAPLTLQLLVENAVKHNITSRETPLQLEIDSDGSVVTVTNSLNLRTSSYSTQTGLKNLVKRYEMLSAKALVVQQDDVHFEVIVPLL